MTYEETLKSLFDILYQANMAGSDQAQDWQHSSDAYGFAGSQDFLYGNIRAAIASIAGNSIIDHWAETGEIDYSLASRSHIGITDDDQALFALVREQVSKRGEGPVANVIRNAHMGTPRDFVTNENLHLFRQYRNRVSSNARVLIDAALEA